MVFNNQSEEDFYNKLISLNRPIIRSSEKDDMYEHIDFYIDNNVSCDIKATKKLNRSDNNANKDIIWLEFKNVRGNVGWLCAKKLNKIVFARLNKFYIFDRQKLLDFIKTFVLEPTIIHKTPIYRKIYRRTGRLDFITYVYYEDIKHLLEEII